MAGDDQDGDDGQDEAAPNNSARAPDEAPEVIDAPRRAAIGRSINEAELLIQFASREGRPIPDLAAKTVVTAAERYRDQTWDIATEVEFWPAFQALSKALHPVSVDGIKATLRTTRSWLAAIRSVAWYAASTLVILAVVVLFQIYWVAGRGVTDDIEALGREVNTLGAEHITISQEIDTLKAQEIGFARNIVQLKNRLRDATPNPINDAAKQQVPLSDLEESLSDLEGLLANVKSEIIVTDLRLKKNESPLERAKTRLRANFGILLRWNFLWPILAGSSSSETSANGTQESGATSTNRSSSKSDEDETSLAFANLLLKSFPSYILPLLYGLLGAHAYILRSLAIEIRNVTFSEESRVRYRLRWPLGMLVGIAVGWFVVPSEQDTSQTALINLSALQPLALAFLAGYSVELFFTALDRMFGGNTGGSRTDGEVGDEKERVAK